MPGSSESYSIELDTNITAASKALPKEPARAGWSFNKWQRTRIQRRRPSSRPQSVHHEVAVAPAVVVAARVVVVGAAVVADAAAPADKAGGVATAAARADAVVGAMESRAIAKADAGMVAVSWSRT